MTRQPSKAARPRAASARGLARIERLSRLGLTSQAIMPALLAEIGALIPSYSREFDWAGPYGEMINTYSDAPNAAAVIPLYFDKFHEQGEGDFVATFAEVMRTSYDTAVDDFYDRCLRIPWRDFLKSNAYKFILEPLGGHRRLHMKVSREGVGLGVLSVNRREADPPFSLRERALLETTAPLIAQALTAPVFDAPLIETQDRGLIVATREGAIEHLSPSALRLLLMANFARWSPRSRWEAAAPLAKPLAALCRRARSASEAAPGSPAPRWFNRNAWGGFDFQAHALDSAVRPPAPSLVGITVTRHEPLPLKLFRSAEALPLSARELDFVLLAATGANRAVIAERMGVSSHTAQTYARSVYAKLGVHTRAELLHVLQSLN